MQARFIFFAIAFAALSVGLHFRPEGARAQQPRTAVANELASKAQQSAEIEDYERALEFARHALTKTEAVEVATKGRAGSETANALGRLAWYALLAGQTKVALNAAGRGYALAPEKHWIETNRLLALVLLGRTKEALASYRTNLKRPLAPGAERSWQDSIEQDLAALLQRGVGRSRITAFIDAAGGLVPRELLRPQPSVRAEREAVARAEEQNKRLTALQASGKSAEALNVLRETVELLKAALGADHRLVGLWLRGVADYQFSLDPKVDVRPLYARALEIAERTYGPDHPETILPLQTLATLDARAGDIPSARRHLERAGQVAEGRGTTQAKALAETLGQLAELELTQNGSAAAVAFLSDGLKRIAAIADEQSEAMALVRIKLADQLQGAGRLKDADDLFVAALPALERAKKPDHLLIARVLSSRQLYLQKTARRSPEVVTIGRQLISHLEAADVPNSGDLTQQFQHAIWNARYALGVALMNIGGWREAEEQLRAVLRYREQEQPQRPDSLAGALSGLGLLMANMERWQEALPLHERALALREKLPSAEDSNLSVTLGQLALAYRHLDRHVDSERMYRRQIELLEHEKVRDAKSLALAYSGLASLFTDTGRLRQAGDYHARAVQALDGASNLDPGDLPLVLEGLALWQKQMGRYGDAEKNGRRALAVREERFGRDDPETSVAISALGSILARGDRLTEAKSFYRRSIAILEAAPTHPRAQRLDIERGNLASLLAKRGHFEEAMRLHQLSLDAKKSRFGEASWQYAQALGNYAELIGLMGDDRAALATNERGLAIMEKVHGLVHEHVATALNNVATSYQLEDRHADAERALRRAIEINERLLGVDHPDTHTNLHNLAGQLRKLGRYNEAIAIYQRLVTERERVLGPDHSNLAGTLTQQSHALSAVGRHDEAIAAAKRALGILTSLFGPEHIDVANAHNALGSAYGWAGRNEDALEENKNALDIRARLLKPDHPDVINSYNNIGAALQSLGRLDEAEAMLRTGLARAETAFGAASHRTLSLRDNLAFVALRRGDWLGAIAALDERIQYELASPGAGMTSTFEISAATQEGVRGSSIAVLQAASMALKEGLTLDKEAERAVFDALQRYVAGAASARLDQLGRRWAARDPRVADLVRQRQDIGGRIAKQDRRITAIVASGNRDGTDLADARSEFSALQARQASLEGDIRAAYPAYFDLVKPKPLSVAEMQALLREGEVAILAATLRTPGYPNVDPGTGLVWAITRDRHRLVKNQPCSRRHGGRHPGYALRPGCIGLEWTGSHVGEQAIDLRTACRPQPRPRW